MAQMPCLNLLGALFRTGTNSCVESLLLAFSASPPLLTNLTTKLSKSVPRFERDSLSIGKNNGAHVLNLERYLLHASGISLLILLDWNCRMLKLGGSGEKQALPSSEVIKKIVSITLAEKKSNSDDIVADPDV